MDPKKAQSDNTKPKQDTLSVEIRNPDKVLFSGNATAVSSKNSIGPLDILPQHENFISLLTDKITVHLEKHQKQEILNQSAIVKAKLNKVNIFLGIETLIAPPPNPGLNKPIPQQNPNPQSQNSK